MTENKQTRPFLINCFSAKLTLTMRYAAQRYVVLRENPHVTSQPKKEIPQQPHRNQFNRECCDASRRRNHNIRRGTSHHNIFRSPNSSATTTARIISPRSELRANLRHSEIRFRPSRSGRPPQPR